MRACFLVSSGAFLAMSSHGERRHGTSPESLLNILSPIIFYLCIYVLPAYCRCTHVCNACKGQNRVLGALEQLLAPCGCWELKLGPLKEPQMFLNAGPHLYLYVCTTVFVWRSGDDMQEPVLSFYHVGPRNQTQVIRQVPLPTKPSD